MLLRNIQQALLYVFHSWLEHSRKHFETLGSIRFDGSLEEGSVCSKNFSHENNYQLCRTVRHDWRNIP